MRILPLLLLGVFVGPCTDVSELAFRPDSTILSVGRGESSLAPSIPVESMWISQFGQYNYLAPNVRNDENALRGYLEPSKMKTINVGITHPDLAAKIEACNQTMGTTDVLQEGGAGCQVQGRLSIQMIGFETNKTLCVRPDSALDSCDAQLVALVAELEALMDEFGQKRP